MARLLSVKRLLVRTVGTHRVEAAQVPLPVLTGTTTPAQILAGASLSSLTPAKATALHLCVTHNRPGLLRCLLDHTADPNAQDDGSNTGGWVGAAVCVCLVYLGDQLVNCVTSVT